MIRGGLVLLAALFVIAPAAAHHRPGHTGGPAPAPGAPSIATAPSIVVWTGSVTISGSLRATNEAGRRIELQELAFPFTGQTWRTVAVARTDTRGSYRFTRVPQRHTKYRIKAGDALSGEALVRVRIRVGRRVDDPFPDRGQTIRFFSTSVGPAHDGQPVYIQRRSPSGRFVTVARTRLRDAGSARPLHSSYSARFRVFRDGVYRVRVRGDADHSWGTSALRRVDVRGV